MGWPDLADVTLAASHGVAGEDVDYNPHDGAAFTTRAMVYEEGTGNDVEQEVLNIRDTRPEFHFRIQPAAPDGLGGRLPQRGDEITTRSPRPVLTYEVREELNPDGEGEIRVRVYEKDV